MPNNRYWRSKKKKKKIPAYEMIRDDNALNFIVSIFWKLRQIFDIETLYNKGLTVRNLKKGPRGQASTKEIL